MNQEQIDTLHVTQQALKGVCLALLTTLSPEQRQSFASALQASAGAALIEPVARTMLADLAQGVSVTSRQIAS